MGTSREDPSERALEIALAGGHHLLLVGPAGSGKSRLVQALPPLLPPLSEQEMEEVACRYRRAGERRTSRKAPPIRKPSPACTLRGFLGSRARPSEMELAHRGILVLDPLTAFRRDVLHAIWQPAEEGVLRVARTIADLAEREAPQAAHLAEALAYRALFLPGPFLEGREK